MAYEKIKRNRYMHPSGNPSSPPAVFPHTSEHHYQDQQEFERPLTRIDSAHLRGDWGVADGLEVAGAAGDAAVAISAGVAVDGAGETIVLADTGHGFVGTTLPPQPAEERSVPVSLGLAAQAGKTAVVTIGFLEMSRGSEGSGGRFEQVPWLRVQDTGAGGYVDDGSSVVLAVVDIDAGGTLTGLRAADSALGVGRRLLGRRTGPLRIKRHDSAADTIDDVPAGTLDALDGGGLRLTVPANGDVIDLGHEGGGSFAALNVQANEINARDSNGRTTVEIDSTAATVNAGTRGRGGQLRALDAAARPAVLADGDNALLRAGTKDNAGDVVVQDSGGRQSILLRGSDAWAEVGTTENPGDVRVNANGGNEAVRLAGAGASSIAARDDGNREVFSFNRASAYLRIGANGNEGGVQVLDDAGRQVLQLSGFDAGIRVGTNGNAGDLYLRQSGGATTIQLEGETGRLWSNNRIIAGNPARYVRSVWMYADNGTSTAEVDLGSARQSFAFVAMTGCDPRHNFDHGDAFALDVFQVDGARTGPWFFGGAHFGNFGDATNIHAMSWWGTGQKFLFRARSFQDATVIAIGFVFHE